MKLIYFFKCNAFKFSLVQSDSSSLFIYMYVCIYLHKYINIYVYMCRNIYLSVSQLPVHQFQLPLQKEIYFLKSLANIFFISRELQLQWPFWQHNAFQFLLFFFPLLLVNEFSVPSPFSGSNFWGNWAID